MEPNLETVNDYLVSVFNDILVIEESELKKSQFKEGFTPCMKMFENV